MVEVYLVKDCSKDWYFLKVLMERNYLITEIENHFLLMVYSSPPINLKLCTFFNLGRMNLPRMSDTSISKSWICISLMWTSRSTSYLELSASTHLEKKNPKMKNTFSQTGFSSLKLLKFLKFSLLLNALGLFFKGWKKCGFLPSFAKQL